MDDGVAFLLWVVGTFALSVLVLSLIDCIERRQRRHEEDAAAAAAAGAQPPRLSIALTILDYVSLPRQRQGSGAAAGDGSTTAAAERPACVFCLGELEDGEEWVVLKNCQHEFHRKCMAKWLEQLKSNCPTCRAAVWPKPPPLADMV